MDSNLPLDGTLQGIDPIDLRMSIGDNDYDKNDIIKSGTDVLTSSVYTT